MAREGRGLRGMMMADNNANTLAWGREQIPSPEINANVMMIRDRGSCSALESERVRSKLFSAIYYPVFYPG